MAKTNVSKRPTPAQGPYFKNDPKGDGNGRGLPLSEGNAPTHAHVDKSPRSMNSYAKAANRPSMFGQAG